MIVTVAVFHEQQLVYELSVIHSLLLNVVVIVASVLSDVKLGKQVNRLTTVSRIEDFVIWSEIS